MKKIDRNCETEKKLDAMWNDLSEKARDVIATTDMWLLLPICGFYYRYVASTTDMWLIDDLFGNLETPEEVNKFIEEEYTED